MPVKRLLFIISTLALIVPVSAQELLLPLQSNPAKSQDAIKIKNAAIKQEPVLELPFFEDFSYTGPYPDQNLWADSNVYINSCYHIHPVSIGVATFDALDKYGKIYEHAEENIYQFVADHITSNKIRLDSVFDSTPKALNPADSVYISFYYQPQGSGVAPIDRDSLVLEFLHTPGYYYIDDDNDPKIEDSNGNDTVWVEDKWVSIWSAEGETLSEFSKDTFPYFKKVIIPITDTTYFRDDFKFRFKNYSSFPYEKTPTNYAGNRSIWNIDYIVLDHGRSMADTFYYDLTFAKPAESLLKNYTSMPWSHYSANENPGSLLKSNLDVAIKNLNNIQHNYTYRYFIANEDGEVLKTYSGGSWNIAPFHEGGYQDYEYHSNPIVLADPFPTTMTEKRHFKIVHAIKEGTTGDDNRRNDTIYYEQVFDNYFAYDNGIPNAGYVLEGFEPQSASRFFLQHKDTLKGVKIFFNHTLDIQNNSPFLIRVWKSLDPEEIVYESEVMFPEYSDELNQYYTYMFDDADVELDGTFYIGWKQTTNKLLNVGYDLNNSAGGNLFYNTDGQWRPSIYNGALMIRPLVAGKTVETQIAEHQEPLKISLYPNPVKGNYLNIKIDEDSPQNTDNLFIQIFDMQGRQIINDRLQQTVSVQDFPNGIYIIRIFDKNSSYSFSERIIISR